MDRRQLLASSGALALLTLAGCSDTVGGPTENASDSPTPTDSPTATEKPPEGEPTVADERLAELALGNAAFALDLHREIADGNTFFSPYSVSAALAMTFAGARGESRERMRETMRFTLGEEVHPAFADLEAALASRETADDPSRGGDDEVDAFRLNVANAVWADEHYPVAEGFAATLDEHYGAGLRQADFAGDPSGETDRINEWVATRTEDRIDELLADGTITPQTVMVLTNAIYFMAGWRFEFDPEDTADATFTALDGAESTVPMMEQHLRADYTSWNGHEAIELPYVGDEVSMVLLLPAEGAFDAVEASLDAETLFGVFGDLSDASGDVRLPRFEYRTKAGLKDALSELGMGPEFTGQADFSGMVSEGSGPWIDDVVHEAFVSVDEEGTEAAAATAVVMADSAPTQSFDLTFDRPFLFCIRDRPTDAVLFLGRVTDAGHAQSE